MNVLDKMFGVSPAVLSLRSQRFELISANLANADTPGYKAVDIDFAQELARAEGKSTRSSMSLAGISVGSDDVSPVVQYRNPWQQSLDGNTVETDQEHALFMDNAIRYQASLNFLGGRIKSIMLALRGE